MLGYPPGQITGHHAINKADDAINIWHNGFAAVSGMARGIV
jgi:hypothetical protein